MFMDTVQSQSSSQNTNLSNNITIGSTGTDFGQFAPINETKPEFKNSNDLGMSMGFLGGTAGAVGMTRSEQSDEDGNTYDGYTPPQKEDDKKDLYIYIGIGLTLLLSVFAIFKSRK